MAPFSTRGEKGKLLWYPGPQPGIQVVVLGKTNQSPLELELEKECAYVR